MKQTIENNSAATVNGNAQETKTSSCCSECLGHCNERPDDHAENPKKALKAKPELLAIIERLATEKEEFLQEFYNYGLMEGREWAKSAHYKSLEAQLHVDVGTSLFSEWDEMDDDLLRYANSLYGKYRLLLSPEAAGEFASGWSKGVEEFIDAVNQETGSEMFATGINPQPFDYGSVMEKLIKFGIWTKHN